MAGKFFQLVELNTQDEAEVRDLCFQWVEALLEDAHVSPIITRDTDMPGWVFIFVIYDNQEAASMIHQLDVTKYFFRQLSKLSMDGPFFRNLEALED